jgi:PD-(D/E)XK endonuclease
MQDRGAVRRDHQGWLLFHAGTATGLRKRYYSPAEIDAFAAYCADADRCYFLPLQVFGARSTIQLRLGPTKNNQQQLINWAKEYEFAATLGRLGAVAQLGERRAGSA